MERNICINCGTEQGYSDKISDFIYCEKCGAKIYADGSVSYDGTQQGIEQMRDNIDFYERRTR